MRVSERYRGAVVHDLTRAHVAGLLSPETFERRVRGARFAATNAELDHVLRDLPASWCRRLLARLATPSRRAQATPVNVPAALRSRTELVIGRSSSCDIVLPDPTVSRRHALLRRGPKGWVVCDLGSLNGTRIDGRRVFRAALGRRAVLTLGDLPIRLCW